jgi:hypothetical protein
MRNCQLVHPQSIAALISCDEVANNLLVKAYTGKRFQVSLFRQSNTTLKMIIQRIQFAHGHETLTKWQLLSKKQ